MDVMIVCSSWTLDSINSLSWHTLPIPLLDSYNFHFWPPKAEVINTFIDFQQVSTLRDYFPITTFMTSIQIPIFFITIKWHNFILPLNFTKEKCIHNKKYWDRKTTQRSCYKRVHVRRDHHPWIENVWWGVRLEPKPRIFVSRTCTFPKGKIVLPLDRVICKANNNTRFLNKEPIFANMLLVSKDGL